MELSKEKIGDLFLSKGDIQTAIKNYLLFLKEMKDAKIFASFANRYYKLLKNATPTEIIFFQQQIISIFQSNLLNLAVKKELEIFIKKENLTTDFITPYQNILEKPFVKNFEQLCKEDKNFEELTKIIKQQSQHDIVIFALDYFILNRDRNFRTIRIDEYAVSLYERYEKLEQALKVAEECLKIKVNPTNVRAIFRICRIKQNYGTVINLSKKYHIFQMKAFDILYELVYYYDFYKEEEKRDATLLEIEKSFQGNKPIQKTLQNFYIKFGKIDKAETLTKFEVAQTDKKFAFAVEETTDDYLEDIRLQMQLASIAELTNGISHEFGQPITNIRYMIQFYSRMIEKKLEIDVIKKVFNSILEETERMGALTKRLSPITSSKNIIDIYSIRQRVEKIINAASGRLGNSDIHIEIHGENNIKVEGDEAKFEQIISNLLFNAIDAINDNTKSSEKKISIKISNNGEYVKIMFSDTGVGIPPEMQRKIFKPFYTTKDTNKGQGLGLFIVWNLLEYIGGKIKINTSHKKGASFELLIPHKSKELNLKK